MSASLNLVTGYRGQAHITSDDVAALNQAIFGDGAGVFDVGSVFAYTMTDASTFQIADGEAIIQGRHVRLAEGETAEVPLTTPETGYNRKDYIILQYAKDDSGAESVNLVLLEGTSTTGTAVLPTLTQEDTAQFGSLYQFPLYSISWSGAELGDIVKIFTPLKIIPTQLAAKQDTITGAASTVTKSNLIAERVLGTNSSGKIGVCTTTVTEVNYLSGTKSKVQTQFDNITTLLNRIGRWYFSASSANLASGWSWSLKKFDTESNKKALAGTLTSSMTNGYWIPPQNGFVIISAIVNFASNSSGARAARLNVFDSKGTVTSTLASTTAEAVSHTMNLSIAGAGYITTTQKLGLNVMQDSGKKLDVSATIRIFFIPDF